MLPKTILIFIAGVFSSGGIESKASRRILLPQWAHRNVVCFIRILHSYGLTTCMRSVAFATHSTRSLCHLCAFNFLILRAYTSKILPIKKLKTKPLPQILPNQSSDGHTETRRARPARKEGIIQIEISDSFNKFSLTSLSFKRKKKKTLFMIINNPPKIFSFSNTVRPGMRIKERATIVSAVTAITAAW